jgi:hypothetical protein
MRTVLGTCLPRLVIALVLAMALAGLDTHPVEAQAGIRGQWRTLTTQSPINPIHLVAGLFPGLETAIRVSLGTPAQMREFWRVWDLMPGRSHDHTK